jgi:deoxyribonuclease IV
MVENSIRLGVHVSIAGGIEKSLPRAAALGCSAMQIFSRNPRGWKTAPLSPRMVAVFQKSPLRKAIDPIVVHTPYLLNLASTEEELHRRSTQGLALDIQRAEQLGADRVVTHLGSAKDKGKASGLQQVVKALREVCQKEFRVQVLLENSAGGGNLVGMAFEELQQIIAGAGGDERLRVCFDSCHGFAAGYDFRSTRQTESLMQKIDQTIGRERLALLHVNDCAGGLGAHLDRHEHIGKGQIGLAGFRSLLLHPVCRKIPMILETPKDHPQDDLRNLARIQKLFQRPEFQAH